MILGTQQKLAINYCSNVEGRRLVAVSGAAGTGKTTIMRQAVTQLRHMGREVALAAPTGRAARRISEATGYPATTIHKLLAYGKPDVDEDTGLPRETTLPGRNNVRPLQADDIFID